MTTIYCYHNFSYVIHQTFSNSCFIPHGVPSDSIIVRQDNKSIPFVHVLPADPKEPIEHNRDAIVKKKKKEWRGSLLALEDNFVSLRIDDTTVTIRNYDEVISKDNRDIHGYLRFEGNGKLTIVSYFCSLISWTPSLIENFKTSTALDGTVSLEYIAKISNDIGFALDADLYLIEGEVFDFPENSSRIPGIRALAVQKESSQKINDRDFTPIHVGSLRLCDNFSIAYREYEIDGFLVYSKEVGQETVRKGVLYKAPEFIPEGLHHLFVDGIFYGTVQGKAKMPKHDVLILPRVGADCIVKENFYRSSFTQVVATGFPTNVTRSRTGSLPVFSSRSSEVPSSKTLETVSGDKISLVTIDLSIENYSENPQLLIIVYRVPYESHILNSSFLYHSYSNGKITWRMQLPPHGCVTQKIELTQEKAE